MAPIIISTYHKVAQKTSKKFKHKIVNKLSIKHTTVK